MTNLVCMLLATLLTACASSSRLIPVEERSISGRSTLIQSDPIVHRVVAGDTLGQIARRYGLSVARLQQYNQLIDPNLIQIGDHVLIPDNARQIRRQVPAGEAVYIWPLAVVDVSSPYGSRKGKHKGVDLRAAKGTSIRASADGKVSFVGRKSGYGRVVMLEHKNGITTLYAHNMQNKVKAGQRVRRGQSIATVGKSGNASGPHLHFEFIRKGRALDPSHYLSH